jgi:hypothetical protein
VVEERLWLVLSWDAESSDTWAVSLWGTTLAILVSATGVTLGLLIQRHP